VSINGGPASAYGAPGDVSIEGGYGNGGGNVRLAGGSPPTGDGGDVVVYGGTPAPYGAYGVFRCTPEAEFSKAIKLAEQASAPATGAYEGALFVDSADNHLKYREDSNGTITDLLAGGGGGGETLAQTLALGNATGGYNLEVSSGDKIVGDQTAGFSGGSLRLEAGPSLAGQRGNHVYLDPGDAFAASGQPGGSVFITAGNGDGAADDWEIRLTSGGRYIRILGDGSAELPDVVEGNGNLDLSLSAGVSGAGNPGRNLILKGTDGVQLTTEDRNGGDVELDPGTGYGAGGRQGRVLITQAPVILDGIGYDPETAAGEGGLFVDSADNHLKYREATNGTITDLLAGGGGTGPLETTGTVIHPGTTEKEYDFVLGSQQLDDSGDSADDHRLLFDTSKGAFRAGRVIGTQWDDASRGSESAAFGFNCTASGAQSLAGGSNTNVYTATAALAFGNQCLVSGSEATGAVALGNRASALSYGKFAHASDSFDGVGDSQYSRMVPRAETSGAATVELTLSDTSTRYMEIPTETTWAFEILIAARQVGGTGGTVGNSAAYRATGCIKNVGTTVSLVGAVTYSVLAEDDASWPTPVVDTVTGADDRLRIQATGVADQDIRWVATVHLTEVA